MVNPDHRALAATLNPDKTRLFPRLKLLTMFRLGLFQLGLGMMSVLTLGILNRVMINELAIPATLVAGAIAMHQFVAPARVWFGQLSDARSFWGYHRTGYIWVGTLLFTTCAFLAVQVMWQLNASQIQWGWSSSTYGWVGVLGLVFTCYGIFLSASSTPFAALLVDVSEEEERSKLVSIVWSMLTVGIVVGAILGSALTKGLTPDTLKFGINRLFLIIPAVVCSLAFIATIGVESVYSRYSGRSTFSHNPDAVSIGRSLRVLGASRQTGIFFTFLMIMTLSFFMQESVLEPYGAEVFSMPIDETTKLNAFWGLGTLAGMASTGFLIVPRLGKQQTTRLGCILVSVGFGLIIAAGFTRNPTILKISLGLLGGGMGVATNGAISLMLDLTAAETAGTFIGAWGLAQAMSRAVATVAGGVLLDLGRSWFHTPILAYGTVFGIQAMGMIAAISFLNQVDVVEFRERSRVAIAQILQVELSD